MANSDNVLRSGSDPEACRCWRAARIIVAHARASGAAPPSLCKARCRC